MAKQRKQRSVKLPPFLAGLKEIFQPVMPALAVILTAIVIVSAGVAALVFRSDYFRMKTVEIRSDFLDDNLAASTSNELLRLYAGKSIFSINLSNISRSLGAVYPDARNIVVTIGLPDRIIANLKFRKPVALIGDNNKCYPIDEEGFVLSSVNYKSLKGLPVILGIDIRRETAGRGRDASRNLGLAIELLRKIKKSRFLASWSANSIDAGDAGNIILYLKGGLEVRIGSEDFSNRLKALEKTLRDTRLMADRIKYIDLRFKDVVIGPK